MAQTTGDVNMVDGHGRAALFRCATKEIRKLVKDGVDVNHRDHGGRTPVLYERRNVLVLAGSLRLANRR